jgi:hypothetical protein
MRPGKRLFVGARISVATANALAGCAETLARRAKTAGVDLRWVAPANYHVTLAFLGWTGIDAINSVCDALVAATTGLERIAFRTSRLGAFPSLDRASVLWAGIAETERSPGHRAKPEAPDQRSEGSAEFDVRGDRMKYGLLAAASSVLLEGAVRWLLAHRLPDGAASCFPGWIDPGVAPLPSRQGWCYGDAAIARVLWLAASAADEPAWRRVALDVARRAAARPLPAGGAIDAGLCHGSAGLAHIFNRHWQATGERVFADAARRWFGRALARIDRVSGGGLLSGRAGVVLALLHAVSAREPTWDRVLLLS